MMTRLVRYGNLDHQGAFYNAQTGRSVPISIDPELLMKQARRRRELAKAPRAVAEASFDAATSSAEATGTKTAVLQGPKKGCSGCSGPTRIFNISV